MVIEPADWIAQPWRNGAGTTHELVRWPAGATMHRDDAHPAEAPAPGAGATTHRDDAHPAEAPAPGAGGPFAVRISVAAVTAPAPFSAFPGYRRWLYLLDGGPVTLVVDGAEVVLAQAADGVAFAGEATVAATAVARASRDLNFMASAALPARAEIVRGPSTHVLDGAMVAVFAIDGEVAVGAGDGPQVLARQACAWTTDATLTVTLAAGAVAAAFVVAR